MTRIPLAWRVWATLTTVTVTAVAWMAYIASTGGWYAHYPR